MKTRLIGLLGLTLLVAACGGGGGEGGAKPAGASAPPAELPDKSPAVMQATARDDAAGASALLANESLRAYSIAHDGFTDGAHGGCASLDDPDGPYGPLPGTFIGEGTFSITFTDAASQPVVSRRALVAGDTLAITLAGCRIGASGAVRNGTLSYAVGDAVSRAGTLTVAGGFSFSDPARGTTLTFPGAGASFAVDLSDTGDAFHGVSARVTVTPAGGSAATWSLESAVAGGSGTVLRAYRMSGTDLEVAIRQSGDGNATPTIDLAAPQPAGGIAVHAGTYTRDDQVPAVTGAL